LNLKLIEIQNLQQQAHNEIYVCLGKDTRTQTTLDIYVSVILKVNSLQFHTNNTFVLVLNRHEILAAMEVELQTINHAKMSLFSTYIPFN